MNWADALPSRGPRFVMPGNDRSAANPVSAAWSMGPQLGNGSALPAMTLKTVTASATTGGSSGDSPHQSSASIDSLPLSLGKNRVSTSRSSSNRVYSQPSLNAGKTARISSRVGRRMEWMLTLRTASRIVTVKLSFSCFPINACPRGEL
jgi:hypothetical protein